MDGDLVEQFAGVPPPRVGARLDLDAAIAVGTSMAQLFRARRLLREALA